LLVVHFALLDVGVVSVVGHLELADVLLVGVALHDVVDLVEEFVLVDEAVFALLVGLVAHECVELFDLVDQLLVTLLLKQACGLLALVVLGFVLGQAQESLHVFVQLLVGVSLLSLHVDQLLLAHAVPELGGKLV